MIPKIVQPCLTEDTEILQDIKDMCTARHYKCKGCLYSRRKLTPLITFSACIFGNCPCDWEWEEKND